jgi:RimJ/RimL family protein N-acetyltransferase
MFFSSAPIEWEQHVKWFQESLTNPNRYLFIYEKEMPIAVLRLDKEDTVAEISINVSSKYRGKGYGTTALIECTRRVPSLGINNLIAKIKNKNTASVAIFSKAGFKEISRGHFITMEYKI